MKALCRSSVVALVVAGAAALPATSAQAQLRVPGNLPGAALPGAVSPLPAPRLVEPPRVDAAALQQARRDAIRRLLREHPAALEADPSGEPVVRGELVLVDPPSAMLDAARAEGFVVLRESALDALGMRTVVVGTPAGMTTAQALQRLRALDAGAVAEFQHLYARSGEVGRAASAAPPTPAARPPARSRVGLIDSGIDRAHPSLAGADLKPWGCGGRNVPTAHGTAIASLLVGRTEAFAGVLPGGTLYAADVYCGATSGGSVEAIVQALAWLAAERVAVINVSLVGPPNGLLEAAVRAAARRGHVVVAAVGNDGPAAPPLYPAAYPDVVGVTGVAPSRQVLPEAGQGPHVFLAAPGSQLAVAQQGSNGYALARGTSFAAPLVAGLLASELGVAEPKLAQQALSTLALTAVDLGPPGRDPAYGWGLVGERMRIEPARLHAWLPVQP